MVEIVLFTGYTYVTQFYINSNCSVELVSGIRFYSLVVCKPISSNYCYIELETSRSQYVDIDKYTKKNASNCNIKPRWSLK